MRKVRAILIYIILTGSVIPLLHAQEEEREAVERRRSERLFGRAIENFQRDTSIVNPTDPLLHYEPYAGKRIASITTERKNVFSKDSPLWLERAGWFIHGTTKDRVIRNDMLFRAGDLLDPEIMVRSGQLLQSRSYIYKADIEAVPLPDDSTAVNIIIRTQDSWSISGDANLSLGGRNMLTLYDANIAGSGNRFSVLNSFDIESGDYGGILFEYNMPNIWGTFFRGNVSAGKSFYYTDLSILAEHSFTLPTDYMAGAYFADAQREHYSLYNNSTVINKGLFFEAWGGKSLYVAPLRASLYLTSAYSYKDYSIRPEVGEFFNPTFFDRKQILVSGGLYREHFLEANMVYGFGVKEFLAVGHKAEALWGYSRGEFSDDVYVGGSYSFGRLGAKENFVAGNIGLGGYIDYNTHRFNRGVATVNLTYFTRLFGSAQRPMREFFNLNYTTGINRFAGSDEVIGLINNRGLRGFSSRIAHRNRLAFSSESVIFSNFRPYGYRFAFFAFADMTLFGNYNNPFRNELYSVIGIGTRIKNDQLIFGTVQLRLSISLGRGGIIDHDYIGLSSQSRIHPYRFTPDRAEIIPYY